MRLLPAVLLPLALLIVTATIPARSAPSAPSSSAPAPKAQVRLDLQLTRATGAAATPVVLGSPVLTTFDGNTGSIQVAGEALSYSISISPLIEKDNQAGLLWNLHLSGTSLPGVNSVALSGATRILLGKDETIAELSLRDPKSGTVSTFRLSGRTTTGSTISPPAAAPVP